MRAQVWSEAARALGWVSPEVVDAYRAEIARLNEQVERCADLHGRVVRAEQTVIEIQGQLAKLVAMGTRGRSPP